MKWRFHCLILVALMASNALGETTSCFIYTPIVGDIVDTCDAPGSKGDTHGVVYDFHVSDRSTAADDDHPSLLKAKASFAVTLASNDNSDFLLFQSTRVLAEATSSFTDTVTVQGTSDMQSGLVVFTWDVGGTTELKLDTESGNPMNSVNVNTMEASAFLTANVNNTEETLLAKTHEAKLDENTRLTRSGSQDTFDDPFRIRLNRQFFILSGRTAIQLRSTLICWLV